MAAARNDYDGDSGGAKSENSVIGRSQPGDYRLALWELPWDDVVFLHIFPCLDIKTLFNLSATCTIVRQMVHSYYKIMRIVHLGNHGPKLSEHILKSLLSEITSCQKLVLKNCKSTLSDDLLSPALKNNKQLRHLDITNCTSLTDHSLQRLSVCCRELTHLTLQNCVWLSPEAITNLALHCTGIRVLDVSGCWHVTDAAVITVSLACRSLQSLNVSRIYGITDRSIVSVAQNSRSIQQINVRDCWRLTDESIWMLMEYSKYLKLIQLKGCRSITWNTVKSLKSKGILVDCLVPTAMAKRTEPPVQV